jgi:NTP pyrophosphatase (non-canonical NTP hydrolase)
MEEVTKLLAIVAEKQKIDQGRNWSNGSATYFEELQKELVEVQAEVEAGTRVHLEDELGDVLWDFLNTLVCLENEGKITASEVFRRSLHKYVERVSGIKEGKTWDEIKIKQKAELKAEEDLI